MLDKHNQQMAPVGADESTCLEPPLSREPAMASTVLFSGRCVNHGDVFEARPVPRSCCRTAGLRLCQACDRMSRHSKQLGGHLHRSRSTACPWVGLSNVCTPETAAKKMSVRPRRQDSDGPHSQTFFARSAGDYSALRDFEWFRNG